MKTIIPLMRRRNNRNAKRSIHALQMRVKKLAEDNHRLKKSNANIHNN